MWRNYGKIDITSVVLGMALAIVILYAGYLSLLPSRIVPEPPAETNETRVTSNETPDTNQPDVFTKVEEKTAEQVQQTAEPNKPTASTEPEQQEPNEPPIVPEAPKEPAPEPVQQTAEPNKPTTPEPNTPKHEVPEAAKEAKSEPNTPKKEVPEAAKPTKPETVSPKQVISVPPEPTKPGFVSNVFVDTDLRQALQDIASQAEVIIVPDETITGMVTCKLQDVPLEKALEIVLAGTSYVVKETPDYYLVCSADPASSSFPVVSETRLVKLNHIKADAAVKLLSTSFSNYVRANPDDNTVSIAARPALMERIVADLKQFDRPSRHVMLDARVVVMEQGELLNLGIEWGWPQISAGTFTDSAHHGRERGNSPEWPWGIQIGYTPGKEFTNSLLMTLNLLTQNDEATVVSSPQVLAQDGQQAQIKVATEEYFKITSPSAYYVQFQLEKIEVGTILTITPRIGDNNEITLDITTEVSDVIARGEDNLPIVTRRTTKNTVRIKDGGTAAVAGLMDSRTRLENTWTPGLTNIPLLGELFRNQNNQRSSRQVAVFVTARLISETDKLSGQPVKSRAEIEPVGKKFKVALQEALLHLKKGAEQP